MMTVWWVILKNDDSMVSYTKVWWQYGELYHRMMAVWWVLLKNDDSWKECMVYYTKKWWQYGELY